MKAETACKIETALELSKPIFEPVDGDAALSSNTISHYHKMLSSMLGAAVKWQLIYDNPCLRVDPPKVEHSEAHYLDEVQAAHLLDLLDDEPIVYRTMITLLLHTGLRRGELCGLEWDDINFELSLLDVQRTSLYLPEKGVFVDETKNSTSRRVLKLTPGRRAAAQTLSYVAEQRAPAYRRPVGGGMGAAPASVHHMGRKAAAPVHSNRLVPYVH